MVSLPPISRDAWGAWRFASIHGYAADMVRVGSRPPDSAVDRATALIERVLPDGPDTPGHEFRSIVTEDGEVVGSIWFAAEGTIGQGSAFIWDIVIDPARRGQGHGRAAMAALEPLARSLGYDAIRLHVFGDNRVARHLYRTSGYEETDVTMAKRIG